MDGIDLDSGRAEVTLRAGGNGICTYVNTRTIYNPQMELSKTPSPTEVLLNGEVTCTHDLKNVGDIALKPMGNMDDIVVDDKCSPVTYAGSPDAELEPGDTWSFCARPTLAEDTENTATATPRRSTKPTSELTGHRRRSCTGAGARDRDRSADRPAVRRVQDANYTYSVTNPGQVPLTDVTGDR